MQKLLLFVIPIICYFVVEQIYGYFWGLVVGIALTTLPMFFGKLKGETIEWKSVLADATLIVIFGVGDIVAANFCPDIASVISSGILTVIIGLLATRTGWKLVSGSLDKLRPGISENPYASQLMRNAMKRMSCWALLATVILIIAKISGDEAAREWLDSYLLVTILLCCLATEIIISHITRRKYKDVEWVPLMTEDGRTVGGAPRPLVHNGSHWLHAVVHLHVINSRGQLLLQLRPKSKKIQPGRWDTAVGGHITFGEDLQKALQRETIEEIGLTNFEAKLTGHYVWKCEAENEYVFVFITHSDGPFNPQNVGEVDELKFWNAEELKKAIGTGILTPNIEKELNDGLLDDINSRRNN